MSSLKERLMEKFNDSYENSYQVFNEFVENELIKNNGVYVMDKFGYYQYCNKENENNSARLYLKRIKRFIKTITSLPTEYPSCISRANKVYERIEYEHINYTGKPTSSIRLKYCIKKFCKEHEDCVVYLYDYEKLYFQVKIDWLKGG